MMKKLVRTVSSIPAEIHSEFHNRVFSFKHRSVPRQKDHILEFTSQERFALVVLDSCRYDFFEEEYARFIAGDLSTVYTPCTYTLDYTEHTWDQKHDLTYVTGMPVQSDLAFERKDRGYRPTDHIDTIVPVWNRNVVKELGAVTPEAITEAALAEDADKLVIHYVQPHAPYVGERRLRDDDSGDWSDNLQEIYRKIGRYDTREKTISDRELREAYRSNLRRALSAVADLISEIDRPVVLTADHGELLGEDGRYIHGGNRHEKLCLVPWFKIDESTIGSCASQREQTTDVTEPTETTVEEQLRHLGYR